MSKYTSFFPSLGSQNKWHPSHMAVHLWMHSAQATWDCIVCLFKLLQTACCVAFCSKCASIHCSEIHRSWIFPKHVTTPSHMTENHKTQSQRHYRDFLGYAGSLPLSKLFKASPLLLFISASAHQCPWAAGWERWAGVTGTLNSIHRRRPQGKEERKIYAMSTSLLYVKIYSLTQRKADLEPRTPLLLTGQSDVYKADWYF